MKKINIALILFLFFVSVSIVLAEDVPAKPCKFYGAITVNEDNNNLETTSVTAYLIETGGEADFDNDNLNQEVPIGNYVIEVNNVNSEIGFKINGVNVDQEAQLCVSGELAELDLTATIENFQGTKEDVETNLENLDIKIGDSNDLSQGFFGEQKIEFKEGENTLIEFNYNFNANKLDLTNVVINKQDAAATTGSIEISGINLQEGQTKTVYIDNVANEDYVCVKDEENAKVSEISDSCTGANEVVVPCTGVATNGYTCVDEGNKLKITGLTHSAIKESSYTAPAPSVTSTSSGSSGGGGGGGGATVVPVTGQGLVGERLPITPTLNEETKEETTEEVVTPEKETTPLTGGVIGVIGDNSSYIITGVIVLLVIFGIWQGSSHIRKKKGTYF